MVAILPEYSRASLTDGYQDRKSLGRNYVQAPRVSPWAK